MRSGILTTLLLAGCSVILPLDEGGPVDAVLEAGSDAISAEGGTPDLSPTPITVSFGPVSGGSIKIGQHMVLKPQFSPTNNTTTLRLTAPPCLLRLKGDVAGVHEELSLSPGPNVELVLFAPPDVDPNGSTCTVDSPDSHVTVLPVTVTVGEPDFVPFPEGGAKAERIAGLTVTTLGTLTNAAKYEMQAITRAGGALGNFWYAVIGWNNVNTTYFSGKSTVQVFRFDHTPQGLIGPWLDLTKLSQTPYVVDDLNWVPGGPCGPALYLASDTPNTPTTSGGTVPKHGMFCITGPVAPEEIGIDRAYSLAVDQLGTLSTGGAKGDLYASRYGGYFRYTGSTPLAAGVTFGATLGLPETAARIRFATSGPSVGHLYAFGRSVSNSHRIVSRIAPGPVNTVTPVAELDPMYDKAGGLALSYGGSFGRLVLVSARREDTNSRRYYDLIAVFAGSPPRQLVLAKSVVCGGAVAFDEEGHRLVLPTADNLYTCTGTRTMLMLEFNLP